MFTWSWVEFSGEFWPGNIYTPLLPLFTRAKGLMGEGGARGSLWNNWGGIEESPILDTEIFFFFASCV